MHHFPPVAAPPLHHAPHDNRANPADSSWAVTHDPSTAHGSVAFQNHMVIPPPENRDPIERIKTTYVVVDSTSRNQSEYPEPNSYSMPLPNEIRDVKSIQLVSYKVPQPQFAVRATNNAYHFTNAAVTVTPAADGGYTVDTHKATNLNAVRVPVGHYDAALFAALAAVEPGVESFRDEIRTNLGVTTLYHDVFAQELENALNAQAVAPCVVYIDEVSLQFTVATNFANPTGDPDDCTNPVFFHSFFQGAAEYYNGSSTERVRVTAGRGSGTPNGCSAPPACPTYETCTFGKQHHRYLKHSVGSIIGHPRVDPSSQLCGEVYSDPSNANRLLGVRTKFTEQVQRGDWLYVVELSTGTAYRVHASSSPTTDGEVDIDCDGAGGGTPPTFTRAFAWSGRLTMPWQRNLQPDCYMSLFVNCARTLRSFTTAIDGAFYLIPNTQAGQTGYYDIPEYMPFKRFNPVMGTLDKLDITFKNPDNTLYDFKGRNHVLMFKVEHYRQNISYGDF